MCKLIIFEFIFISLQCAQASLDARERSLEEKAAAAATAAAALEERVAAHEVRGRTVAPLARLF